MKIPRPSGGSRQSAGVGKIYVKFDNPDSARKALAALAGRKFADRTVVTTYFSEAWPTYIPYAINTNSRLGEFRSQRLVVTSVIICLFIYKLTLTGAPFREVSYSVFIPSLQLDWQAKRPSEFFNATLSDSG